MRCCGAVAAPRSLLAISGHVAKLIALEALLCAEIGTERLAIKDLGLPDQPIAAKSLRCVDVAHVERGCSVLEISVLR